MSSLIFCIYYHLNNDINGKTVNKIERKKYYFYILQIFKQQCDLNV